MTPVVQSPDLPIKKPEVPLRFLFVIKTSVPLLESQEVRIKFLSITGDFILGFLI